MITASARQVTLHTSATATADGTFVLCHGAGAVGVYIANSGGTFTIAFETTVDNTNWVACEALKKSDNTRVTTTSATGWYVANVGGANQFRARISAASGCSLTATAIVYEGEIVDLTGADDLSNIEANTEPWGINDVATSGAVTYVGKEQKDGTWYVMSIDTTSDTAIQHATITNNSGVATYTAAWAAKASTLVYGDYGAAF